jgi:hypothetical protein
MHEFLSSTLIPPLPKKKEKEKERKIKERGQFLYIQ